MTVRARGMNPQILRWAREGLGLSVEEVAERMRRPVEVVRAWEEGSQTPTFNQLERLAESVYKRPVAVFFFPTPPPEPPVEGDFRTLPESEFDRLERDTRLAIREAKAYQLSIAELSGGVNPAGEDLITRRVRVGEGVPVAALAASVREHLDIPLETQQSWRSAEVAFKAWREAVEAAGVHVFKRSMEQREISGFCLHHPEFPLILVNNSTPHTRQTFTLFHELAHLLFGISSITTTDFRFLDRLEGSARLVEMRCNAFAAEFLVPEGSFPWNEVDPTDWEETASRIARLYSVSREVILRRLLEHGHVSRDTYERRAQEWIDQGLAARGQGRSGGSYYANQSVYLGNAFLDLGFSQYRAGNVSRAELADHFGMRAETVGRLEDYLLTRRSAR